MSAVKIGHIELPDHFRASPEERRAVAQLASARLPFEVDIRWQMDRRPFVAEIIRVAQCPRVVPFEQWRPELDKCKPGEIFVGLDRNRKPYRASFLTDDPHWGFEVGSRRGKSTFLSITAAQILHQDPGASVTGIDVKRESFKALFGVPRLILSNDPRNITDMWDKVHEFRQEMDRRCDARADDPSLEFPFALLMLDELSQFSAQSQQLWRGMKEPKDPAHPPVWDDIAAIMWQGAAFRCHVLMAGQRIDHQITGGIGLITSLGFRGLAGFRKQNWERLIGTHPIPRSRPERGRWIYSDGDSETWVQNLWATDAEIKTYAMEVPGAGPTAEDATWLVGLAAGAGHLGLSVDAFRKRRERDPVQGEERRGNQPMWRPAALDEWANAANSPAS